MSCLLCRDGVVMGSVLTRCLSGALRSGRQRINSTGPLRKCSKEGADPPKPGPIRQDLRMSRVYVAHHRRFWRRTAMSVIKPATPDDPVVESSALSSPSRRQFLIGSATIAAGACLPTAATAAAYEQANTSTPSTPSTRRKGDPTMSSITTKDGVEIFYKDWGKGQPIVFSHGWPVSADDWDAQMLFFLSHGYRVIAHDRRGHGRSAQTGEGHDMDHYADDLAALTAHLDLKNAVHVGHSTGA